jgi:hypothetical protein
MSIKSPLLTRRGFGLGLSLGAAALASGKAWATPSAAFPLRIAVAHVTPQGLGRVPAEHQQIWSAFATRLGGLVDEIAPVQPVSIVDLAAPEEDGGANTISRARGVAERIGCGHVVLYATTDGIRHVGQSQAWVNRVFDSLREQLQVNDRPLGEAHLLDVSGGAPLASATADVDPTWAVDWFTGRNAQTQALRMLTGDLERRVQGLARAQLAAQTSIAD